MRTMNEANDRSSQIPFFSTLLSSIIVQFLTQRMTFEQHLLRIMRNQLEARDRKSRGIRTHVHVQATGIIASVGARDGSAAQELLDTVNKQQSRAANRGDGQSRWPSLASRPSRLTPICKPALLHDTSRGGGFKRQLVNVSSRR